MNDFDWSRAAFIDGMAPLDYRKGKAFWKPKTRWAEWIRGASNGRAIALSAIVKPQSCIYFHKPEGPDQDSLDFKNWRGYFDREFSYSSLEHGTIFNRWLVFRQFFDSGLSFEAEFDDAPVTLHGPSIVFFGASWTFLSSIDEEL